VVPGHQGAGQRGTDNRRCARRCGGPEETKRVRKSWRWTEDFHAYEIGVVHAVWTHYLGAFHYRGRTRPGHYHAAMTFAAGKREVSGLTCLIPTREFALYSLNGPNLVADEICSLPFSFVRYSRYKYGSVTAAETFARALGAAFGERHPELARAPRLLMASSPYTYYRRRPPRSPAGCNRC